MPTIGKFEEIQAWRKGRELARAVYQVTANGEFARDFGLKDQIRRASVSVISNIAEGYERGRCREFLHFLSIARGSAGEVRAQLYVALDASLIDRPTFERLSALAYETSRLISGFMRYLSQDEGKVASRQLQVASRQFQVGKFQVPSSARCVHDKRERPWDVP